MKLQCLGGVVVLVLFNTWCSLLCEKLFFGETPVEYKSNYRNNYEQGTKL